MIGARLYAPVLVTMLAATLGTRPRATNADARALDRWLRRAADTAGFSGVVLIESGGKIILDRAYSPPKKQVLSPQSAFWIGSATKQFTAAAILRLVDEGKLATSDSLYRFFRFAPRRARAITIEQLLTHTSGLAAAGAANGVGDREEAMRAILSEPLRNTPGTAYHYESEDYNVLAAIVEIASGTSFEAFVDRALLIPAGLTHTDFCGRVSRTVPIARSLGAPKVPPPCTAAITPIDWADRGATGLVSTASDLLKWTHAVRNGRLLSATSQRDLERGHVFVRTEGDADVYYSYGARVYMEGDRRREVWHSGYDVRVGQSSAVRILDSGLTIVVLSNAGLDGNGQPWASGVARLATQYLGSANSSAGK